MRVVTWDDGRVATGASVAVSGPLPGAALRDAYVDAVRTLTFGLVRMRNDSLVAGPIELLRFGSPKVTRNAVEWPIEGGLLARQPGGRFRVQASGGQVEATVTGYAPSLPRPIYTITHLQVHQLFTRLYLLRLRGREPAPGTRASSRDRFRAASVDVAFCLTVARMTGRPRWGRTLAILTAYHVACWSTTGRTLGGIVVRQRVVSVDGSRLTPAQSLLRLALLPASWLMHRPLHDDLAATDVIID
jgi:RDD family